MLRPITIMVASHGRSERLFLNSNCLFTRGHPQPASYSIRRMAKEGSSTMSKISTGNEWFHGGNEWFTGSGNEWFQGGNEWFHGGNEWFTQSGNEWFRGAGGSGNEWFTNGNEW